MRTFLISSIALLIAFESDPMLTMRTAEVTLSRARRAASCIVRDVSSVRIGREGYEEAQKKKN